MNPHRHACVMMLRLLVLATVLLPRSSPAMGRRRAAEEERLRTDYRSLEEFAASTGLAAPVEIGDRIHGASNQWASVSITTGSRRAAVNGRLVWMSLPNLDLADRPALSRLDEEKTLRPILLPEWTLPPNDGEFVVLDPGHGGHDTGARGPRGALEKTLSLDIAARIAGHLEARGVPWKMTRQDDRFVELAERSRLAAAARAKLFVSLHFNSGSSEEAGGVESYALSLPGTPSSNDPEGQNAPAESHPGNRFDEANVVLAYCIQQGLLDRGVGGDRGVRRARFSVLREAPCPAALVECGFLSNPDEEKNILDAGHREKIAASVTDGIMHYLNHERRAEILRETPPRTSSFDEPVMR